MNAPLCTPEDAAELGFDVPESLLKRASVRIRSYAGTWIEHAAGEEWLAELTASVAQRLSTITADSALVQGITSEGAGGETVAYGQDAWMGVTGLTSGEKAIIDDHRRRRRGGIRVHHMGA